MPTKVEIILQGTDQASGPIRNTSEALHGLESAAGNAGGALGKMGGIAQTALGFVAGGIVSAGLNKIAEWVGGMISGMIGGNAEFERYQTQFTTLLGSADAAKQRLDELSKFAATTPFQLPEVVRADKILQSFGFESEQAKQKFGFSAKEIRTIAGDTAAGAGASFEDMSMLLGKFSSGATGEALMRFAELGIVTRDQLRDMGLQFSKSGELLSPLPEATSVLLTAMKEKYGGLMQDQMGTFEGMMSNLQDWVGQTERAVGKPIFDALKTQLGGLLQVLGSDQVKSAIDGLGNTLAGGVTVAVNAFMGLGSAVGPVVGVVGGFFSAVQNGQAPIGALVNAAASLGLNISGFVPVLAMAQSGLSGLATIAQGVLSSAFQSFGQVAQVVLAGLPNYLAAVLPNIMSLASVVGSLLLSAFQSFGQIAQAVFSILPSLTQTAMSVLTSFAGTVSGLVAGAFQLLQPIAISVFQGIASIAVQIMPSVQNLATSIGGLLVASFQAVQMVATAVFSAVQPYIPALQSAIQQVAGVVGSVLVTALQGASGFITGTAIPAIMTLASWLAANLPGAIQAVAGFVQGSLIPALAFIGDKLNQYVVPALGSLASVFTTSVLPVLGEVAGFVGGVLLGAWTGLVNFIMGAAPTLGSVVEGAFQIIGGVINVAAGVIQTFVGLVHGLITGDWAGAWEEAQSGVQKVIDGVGEILRGSIETIKGIVVSIMNGLVSAITGGKTDAAGAAQGVVDTVSDVINGLIDRAKDSGRRLIESFADGIRSAISSARSAVEAAVSAVDQYLPHSDAETGPLSQLTASGAALFATWGRGVQSGVGGALSVVQAGLSAIAQAIKTGDAATAMNELASLFRAIILGFASNSEGIGGNAYTHIKRLIDAITSISGAIGDFLKALDVLIQFGQSAAGRLALVESGQAYLVWLFDTIAHLAQQMAIGARSAADHFINSEVGATLVGLAQGIAGIKAVVEAVVGNVESLVTATGGGGQTTAFERLLSDPNGQNWILALIRAVVSWAVRVAADATQAAGEVPAATASLSNLGQTLSPVKGVVDAVVGLATSLFDATEGGGQKSVFEKLLNSESGRNWIASLVGAIITWAVQIDGVAQRAAGTIPAATASLTNLGNNLQPISGVISSTVGIIKGIDEAISNSTVMGVVNGPMSDLIWKPLYELIASKIVSFAVDLASAATRAVGTVPQASASLSNLNSTLQPFTGVITSTLGAIKTIGEVAGDNKLLALLGGQGASLAQGLYFLIAAYLVQFAVGIKSAVEAALPTVKAASDSLQNLAGALGPINSILGGVVSILKTLSDWVKAPIQLTQDMTTSVTTLGTYLQTLWIAWATVVRAFSPSDASIKAAEAWQKAAGLFAPLTQLTGLLGQLRDWVKAPIPLTEQMTTALTTLGMYLQLLWITWATVVRTFSPTQASMDAAEAWGKAAGLFVDLSRFTDFLAQLRDWVKAPIALTSQMDAGLRTLGMSLQLLWVTWATVLHTFTPSEASLTAVAAWNKAAGLFADLSRFTEFLAKLRDWTKEPVYLTSQMDTQLRNLGMALQLLWLTWATTMHTFAPTEASLAAAEAWGKAAGLFAPLSQLMDALRSLNDWTKKPVEYTAAIQTSVVNLLSALKDMTGKIISTAQSAGISESMQKAADALMAVAGPGLDVLQKAMSTIKSLFEFKIENGPGWVQEQGGNNIWSTGSSTPGIPGAEGVKAKVDQLMAAVASIVTSIKAGLSSISLGEDTEALKTKLADILSIVSNASELVKKAQDIATGGGAVALSISIAADFKIADLSAEVAKIPIPTIHIPVVFDLPGSGGGNNGSTSVGGGNTNGGSITSGGGNTNNGSVSVGGGNTNGGSITSGGGNANGGSVTININLASAVGLSSSVAALMNLGAG